MSCMNHTQHTCNVKRGLFPFFLPLPQAVCSGGSARCEGVPVEGGRSDRGEPSLCRSVHLSACVSVMADFQKLLKYPEHN